MLTPPRNREPNRHRKPIVRDRTVSSADYCNGVLHDSSSLQENKGKIESPKSPALHSDLVRWENGVVVDAEDFIDWNANKFSNTGKWSLADANADGVTDAADFILWNITKFMSSDGVSTVPEPAMGVLLIAALTGLAVTRPHGPSLAA